MAYSGNRAKIREDVVNLVKEARAGKTAEDEVVVKLMYLMDVVAENQNCLRPPFLAGQLEALGGAQAKSFTFVDALVVTPARSVVRFAVNTVIYIVTGIACLVVFFVSIKIFYTAGSAFYTYL